ncbi:hypothetical protein O181_003104 [Austropuccinia psidii MF-1]|uniref:Uncharacterized protein n=1 Tax=Austropuccinia psidii MF-1 TaxID=1389203 RepID=A0A9Q3GDI2_9BASI|nr:hypothetical protein [Austropuccinia psidii MF-1]
MVHTRNGSDYSVQQDGSGQERGQNRKSCGRLSSRKVHLEDARVSPHSPKSVPTTFNINSDPKLIQGNDLRVEKIKVEAIEIYLSHYKDWYREAKKEEWEIFPSL